MLGLGIGELVLLLAIFVIGSPLYFAPLIVAFVRGHRSRTAIALINTLLGWSGIAWIAVLIWAIVGDSDKR